MAVRRSSGELDLAGENDGDSPPGQAVEGEDRFAKTGSVYKSEAAKGMGTALTLGQSWIGCSTPKRSRDRRRQ